MAGQGTSIGHEFKHIKDIYNQSNFKNNLGVCLDTCHIFSFFFY